MTFDMALINLKGGRNSPQVRIGFIIAAYNGEEFILDSVNSCYGSCLPFDIIPEVVVVDDGSEDSTWSLLCDLSKNYNTLITDRFDRNVGKVAAYNHAFGLCCADWVCIMAADDVTKPERIAELLRNGGQYDMVCGGMRLCDTSMEVTLGYRKVERKHLKRVDYWNPIPGGVMCIRRSVLAKYMAIPEVLRFEDWWISYSILKGGHAVYISEKIFLDYRQHANNTLSGNVRERELADLKRHIAFHHVLSVSQRKHLAIHNLKKSILEERWLLAWGSLVYFWDPPFAKRAGRVACLIFKGRCKNLLAKLKSIGGA